MRPNSSHPSRRRFLQSAAAVSLGFTGLQLMLGKRSLKSLLADPANAGFGPLIAAEEGGYLDLPSGFRCRLISRQGDEMSDGLLVPGKQDGMAAFPGPDGKTLLVCNHELMPRMAKLSPFGPRAERFDRVAAELLYDPGIESAPCLGGTTTLLYDTREQRLERQFLSLGGTCYNCAGGPTPWDTWITCEETTVRAGAEDGVIQRDHGFNFEVPARADGGLVKPVPLKAMGRFKHEAVAVDPRTGFVYQTEDIGDGCIYRFLPNEPGRLAAGGRLQALVLRDRPSWDTRNWPKDSPVDHRLTVGTVMSADWIELDDVESPADDLRLRAFRAGAARFARAEGMWYGDGVIYFCCTNGGEKKAGQVWRYTPSPHAEGEAERAEPGRLELFLEPNDTNLLENGDNVTIAPWGDLLICEDGPGDQFLVGVTPRGELYKLARNAIDQSEFAGATFSPDGSTLFVNLQHAGVTLAITGPWRRRSS